VAPPGNQAVNGENKPQPVASGETGLLDSKQKNEFWLKLSESKPSRYIQSGNENKYCKHL
jgi:hypothetical protein